VREEEQFEADDSEPEEPLIPAVLPPPIQQPVEEPPPQVPPQVTLPNQNPPPVITRSGRTSHPSRWLRDFVR